MREPVRPLIEFGVGQGLRAEGDRGKTAVRVGRVLEQPVQAASLGRRGGQRGPGRGGGHGELPDRPVTVFEDGSEQHAPVRGQPADGFRVEQVAAVLGLAAQLTVVEDGPGQVELRGAVGPDLTARRRRTEAQRLAVLGVCAEDHLHQRGMPGRAVQADLVDDLVEGQVRIGEAVDGDVLDVLEQFAEGHRGAQPDPQRQQVDEVPHQVFQLRPVPCGHRRADDQIVGAGVPVEQEHEGRKQHHERGHALGLRQRPDFRGRAGGQAERLGAAAVGRPGGARPVAWQRQQWGYALEMVLPVRQVLLEGSCLLLDGVVGVLGGQLRQHGGAAIRQGVVAL